MKVQWKTSRVISQVSRSIQDAGIILPEDVRKLLKKEAEQAKHTPSPGSQVLQAVMETVSEAEKQSLPICQDTGTAVIFADIGTEGEAEDNIEQSITEAVRLAYREGKFRPSMVSDPVFERRNTGNNLPPVIHCRFVPGRNLRISGLLKGFGSENCSSLTMLNPTDGEEGVLQAVLDSMQAAGGKPCPPVFIGVGVGGTAEQAGILAKRALLREAGSPHQERAYALLEKRILQSVNNLDIGPGGLGGKPTALAVSIEHAPTHIAGMPVAVNISCWADRKFFTEIAPHVSE